jgi:hypothetical protein
MSVFEWWRDRRDRIAAEREETAELLRETFLFDRAEVDPVVERFEDTRRSLVDLIPAAPLCSPALRHWKEIEAGLCSDRTFIPGVDAALRDSQT